MRSGMSAFARATVAWTVTAVAVLLPCAIVAAQLARKGGEFQINSSLAGDQLAQRVAALSDGGFLVVWESSEGDADGSGVFGRRFRANAEPVGTEFQLGSTTTGDQREPGVAVGPDGSALVAWSIDGAPFVVGQRLDAGGTPGGAEHVIPDSAFPYGAGARVAPAEGGDFVVVWTDFTGPGTYRIRGRKTSSDGAPSGPSFLVTGDNAGRQYDAAVAGHPDDSFMVVWFADVGNGGRDEAAIMGRSFQRGEPYGAEFVVGAANSLYLSGPEICSTESGFVVTWATYAGPSSSTDHPVRYRFYERDGSPLTEPLRATPEVPDARQGAPAMACGPGDAFVLAWGECPGVRGRVFEGNDTADFSIGVTGASRSRSGRPALARLSSGDFVVTWSAACDDQTGCDLFGQVFTSSPPLDCPGDCDRDGVVRVNELITGVRATLSGLPSLTRQCLPLDVDLNYQITIDEVVTAVAHALEGCAAS